LVGSSENATVAELIILLELDTDTKEDLDSYVVPKALD